MAFGGRNAVSKLGLDKHKSIQLSKHGPSDTVLVLTRKQLLQCVLTDVDT